MSLYLSRCFSVWTAGGRQQVMAVISVLLVLSAGSSQTRCFYRLTLNRQIQLLLCSWCFSCDEAAGEQPTLTFVFSRTEPPEHSRNISGTFQEDFGSISENSSRNIHSFFSSSGKKVTGIKIDFLTETSTQLQHDK